MEKVDRFRNLLAFVSMQSLIFHICIIISAFKTHSLSVVVLLKLFMIAIYIQLCLCVCYLMQKLLLLKAFIHDN
jgi:hypothetical protein